MSPRESTFKELKQENSFAASIFHPTDAQVWDDFVAESNNGTMFHTRRFLSYHAQDRFEDSSLLFKKRGKLVSLLPAAVLESEGRRVLVSHPGSSMAGPVFKKTLSLKDSFFIVECLLAHARAESIDEIRLTLPPLIYHARPGNYFDFALMECGFSYLKREVSSVIPLDFVEDDTLLIFSPEARRAARKARKIGVVVTESDDFAGFYDILQKNLKMRHNVQPTHTLEELLNLRALFPDTIKLFTACKDGEMVAGVVMFECNERVGLAFYISHRESAQEVRGVNILFQEVIQWAIRKGLNYLDFGVFTVNMKPNWGLARFKESFGALGVFRDTLVKTI